MIYTLLKIYFMGLVILSGAIILNSIAAKIGIIGWYDFLRSIIEKGSHSLTAFRVIDYGWLFIFYPIFLGLTSLGAYLLYDWINSCIK